MGAPHAGGGGWGEAEGAPPPAHAGYPPGAGLDGPHRPPQPRPLNRARRGGGGARLVAGASGGGGGGGGGPRGRHRGTARGAGARTAPTPPAYHALFNRARGEAGETVLVHGASGGVGIGAVQLARARGLTVIGTAGTEKGRRMVLEQGAHPALDHTAARYLEESGKLTRGRGPPPQVEMRAHPTLPTEPGAPPPPP